MGGLHMRGSWEASDIGPGPARDPPKKGKKEGSRNVIVTVLSVIENARLSRLRAQYWCLLILYLSLKASIFPI
jgi:hypothetical protein